MELISKERAIEDICSIESEVARNMPYDKEWFDRMCDRQHEIIEIIKALPPVQIERTGNTVTMTSKKFLELIEKTERPRGHWIGTEYDGYADGNPVYHLWECSVCEFEVEAESSYCPCCGSQMVEEEENER